MFMYYINLERKLLITFLYVVNSNDEKQTQLIKKLPAFYRT